jgi:hypothetical protein
LPKAALAWDDRLLGTDSCPRFSDRRKVAARCNADSYTGSFCKAAHIISSVRDEYFRLGDVAGLKHVVIGTEAHSTQLLRDAYEMVAVADNHRVPLPVEVLVSALGVGYGVWLQATSGNKSVWGLLYPDDSPDGGTYYRTRNSIITRMLIETINGGQFIHGAELQILTKLLSAGRGKTTPIYREFCVRLLVPHAKLEMFSFSEGLQLYDAALGSLRHPDRTLLHHKALWVKNFGNNPLEAEQILTQVLNTPSYPYTDRQEAPEHIHTSLAATILDGIEKNVIPLDEGRQKVYEHLAKSRSAEFFNPNSVHVHANLALRLIKAIEPEKTSDSYIVANTAVADIDRTILMLQNPLSRSGSAAGHMEMLGEVRGKIYTAIESVGNLEETAMQLWESYQSQDGFVLVARKLLDDARAKNKGTAYRKAYDYCLKARRLIDESGTAISTDLSEVQMQIYYYWYICRSIASPQTGITIEWSLLEKYVVETLHNPDCSRNPLYRFIHALSLAHLDNWAAANALFTKLRHSGLSPDVLWKPRLVFLNPSGGPRRLQGVVRDGVGRKILHVVDLQSEFPCDKKGDWPRDGETAFAYLQFSFGGATALDKLT